MTDRYMEDLFEDVPYIDPIDHDQNDNIDSDNNDYQETPQTQRPAALRCPEYQSPPEETPYPQERRHDPREEETPVTATEATASRHEHYSEDQDDTPYMDMDVDDHVENVPEEVSEDVADQVPVEEVGEQITPRPHDPEQEEVPTMLDEVAFHGADLAGGEGEIPLAIMRVTDPVIRREVRNAHYNLGHPSTATLLRIMRRSGASDAAQRYARWWKCPLCAQRQAPRAQPDNGSVPSQHVHLDGRLRSASRLRRERVEVRCTQHRRPRHWLPDPRRSGRPEMLARASAQLGAD